MKKILIPSAYLKSDLDDLDKVSHFYTRFISENGGMPIIAPSVKSLASDYVALCDAVLMIGGVNDVSPSLYNQEINGASDCNLDQDLFELEIIKQAIFQRKPLLGICRGMQLINVYFGGSLIQHLDSSKLHLQYAKQEDYVHTVNISNSRFFSDQMIKVNSVHHQACNKLGNNLVQIGLSDDGLIEAFEHDSLPILGVEWHPECIPSDQFSIKIIDWLFSS